MMQTTAPYYYDGTASIVVMCKTRSLCIQAFKDTVWKLFKIKATPKTRGWYLIHGRIVADFKRPAKKTPQRGKGGRK